MPSCEVEGAGPILVSTARTQYPGVPVSLPDVCQKVAAITLYTLEVPVNSTCKGCDTPIEQPATGRRRLWCGEECRRAQRPDRAPEPRERTAADEPIWPIVSGVVDALELADNDPARVLAHLALDLARELDANPGNIPLARELRQTTSAMIASAPRVHLVDGEVDEDRVEFLASRVRSITAAR
jgi:hypothetical protein